MKDLTIALYSGAGIGLLIGVLMGLALSPTVGVIIGALASVLAVLLGLNDSHFSNAKAIRIGSFGFACVIGALLGIFIRVNSLLAPNIKSQFDAYIDVGYSEKQARDFIAYERFGILDKEWKLHIVKRKGSEKGDKGTDFNASLAQTRAVVGLYAAEEISESKCKQVSELNEEFPLPNILNLMDITGGIWKKLALAVEKEIEESQQKKALLAIKNVLCASGIDRFKDEDCRKLVALAANSSTEKLFEHFQSTGGTWQKLAAAVRTNVSKSEQGKVLQILIRSICYEKT
jgi:hypothetical protein